MELLSEILIYTFNLGKDLQIAVKAFIFAYFYFSRDRLDSFLTKEDRYLANP